MLKFDRIQLERLEFRPIETYDELVDFGMPVTYSLSCTVTLIFEMESAD